METNIYQFVKKIETKKDFELFLKMLNDNFSNKNEEWENESLASYLSGMSGYVFDIKIQEPSWKQFAEILLAAKVYE